MSDALVRRVASARYRLAKLVRAFSVLLLVVGGGGFIYIAIGGISGRLGAEYEGPSIMLLVTAGVGVGVWLAASLVQQSADQVVVGSELGDDEKLDLMAELSRWM